MLVKDVAGVWFSIRVIYSCIFLMCLMSKLDQLGRVDLIAL